jgi:hypothetical protein
VNVGRQVGIDDEILDTSLDPDDYDQRVLETLDIMGVLDNYYKDKKPPMKETLKKMLHYVCQPCNVRINLAEWHNLECCDRCV